MLRLAVGVVLLSLTAMNTVAQEGATGVLVFVEGSTVSSFSGSGGTWGGSTGGTTEPQTIEVMKQLRRFCPNVRITADRAAADFLILHERQAGGTFGGNRNNVAVFGKDDLLVYADGAKKLDNSVKDLCESGLLTGPGRIALFPHIYRGLNHIGNLRQTRPSSSPGNDQGARPAKGTAIL